MMRYFFLGISALALLPACPAVAQDLDVLLRKCETSCRAVTGGSYEVQMKRVADDETDTTVERFAGTFRRVTGDTLFGEHLLMKRYGKDGLMAVFAYDGKAFVEAWEATGVATWYPVDKFAEDIAGLTGKCMFFKPLSDLDDTPLAAAVRKNGWSQQYIGEERLAGVRCWHVRLNELPYKTDEEEQLRYECHYWIDRQSGLPIRYDRYGAWVSAGDTTTDFVSYRLLKHRFVTGKKAAYPPKPDLSAYKTKRYERPQMPVPLAVGTVAPPWALKSVDGEQRSLESLHGKWVLLDFFFMSCPPCTRSLPLIHELRKDYPADKLVVVGIDPSDADDERFRSFLKQKKIDYPVLLESRDVAAAYNVQLFPSFYLVDPEGIIRYVSFGFGDAVFSDIRQVLGEQR